MKVSLCSARKNTKQRFYNNRAHGIEEEWILCTWRDEYLDRKYDGHTLPAVKKLDNLIQHRNTQELFINLTQGQGAEESRSFAAGITSRHSDQISFSTPSGQGYVEEFPDNRFDQDHTAALVISPTAQKALIKFSITAALTVAVQLRITGLY